MAPGPESRENIVNTESEISVWQDCCIAVIEGGKIKKPAYTGFSEKFHVML